MFARLKCMEMKIIELSKRIHTIHAPSSNMEDAGNVGTLYDDAWPPSSGDGVLY